MNAAVVVDKAFKRLVRFPIPEDLTSLVKGVLLVHRKAKIKLCWITTSVYDLFGQKDNQIS